MQEQITPPYVPNRPLVSIVWSTNRLGCDGESIALTAATNPSLEDLLRGFSGACRR